MPFRVRAWQFAAPLVLLLLVVACGGEGEPKTATQTAVPEAAVASSNRLDPCTLVSKVEIEQVLGREVDDPQPNPGNAAICDFRFNDQGSVSFTVQRGDAGAMPDRMVAELKKRNIPVTEASGIGDRSFFVSHGYGITQLNTFRGQHYVILTLSIPGATEGSQRAAAAELMQRALSKL
jgi:hypothetical protein